MDIKIPIMCDIAIIIVYFSSSLKNDIFGSKVKEYLFSSKANMHIFNIFNIKLLKSSEHLT